MRKMSMVNLATGFVLTKMSSFSPAFMDWREQ